MKRYFFTLFIFTSFVTISLFGQKKDTWTVIWNEDSTLLGFEDQHGNVQVHPKLERGVLGQLNKFDDVVALWKKKEDGKYESYYMNKSKHVFGVDSVYILDFTMDCEKEGFIRFVGKDQKVGPFDKEGKIVVPAIYNALTKVRNGMMIGLKDAEKEYWDLNHEDPDTFGLFSWVGGTEELINTRNEVLAENIKVMNVFNFSSLNRSSVPDPDKTRISFKARDGQFLSFIDYQEEFKVWLMNTFLSKLREDDNESLLFEQIICETSKLKGKISKDDMLKKHFSNFKRLIFAPFDYGYEYSFSIEDMNNHIYDAQIYEQFFNNCGDSDMWDYPDMIFEARKDKSRYIFHFIRIGTDDYKLAYCYQD